MINVEGLTRKYGTFTAVDNVSFACQPGRVTGFLGPNGAGKTTTMRVMVGLTPPTSGRVTIGGHLYQVWPNPGLHVGVLLDASAQHAARTRPAARRPARGGPPPAHATPPRPPRCCWGFFFSFLLFGRGWSLPTPS